MRKQPENDIKLNIDSKRSMIHLGSLDSFDITEGGKSAGKKILEYLDTGDLKCLEEARHIYDGIIPNENFGGEYTALEWLCNYWLAPPEAQRELLSAHTVESFYELLSENDFYNLKWYLNRKYHFIEIDRKDTRSKDQLRFLEDFILFNNPDRMRWEKTEDNLSKLPLKPGMKIADVGSGPGYFSFKFADMLGPFGKVYAIETNPKHLDYLNGYIKKYGVKNVEAVTSSFDGIGLDPKIRVDIVFMCSLYHNVYAAFTDDEREAFVGSIRRALKSRGFLIIVDNDMVEDEELPYHGPHISRELLISQLHYYGFRLIKQFSFTVQRYVLIFKKESEIPACSDSTHAEFVGDSQEIIKVTSPSSLVRYRIIGTSTSGYTLNGKRTALKMYEGLEKNSPELLKEAAAGFEYYSTRERIGDDYTALLWFARNLSDNSFDPSKLDVLERDYFDFFTENGCEKLKGYLRNKFDFATPLPDVDDNLTHECMGGGDIEIGVLNEWNEYLTFNNPNRYLWEKTPLMLDFLNIKEGEAIADIGCGSGYFSYAFAKRVGALGKVYATETNPDALEYLKKLSEKHSLNIETIVGKLNDSCLPVNSVDTVFMCSMYHAVYIANLEFVKDQFIQSIKVALRQGGRLIVVDNDINPKGAPAYFGPGIAKELVIAQLKHYGFVLKDMRQFVPQRYMLEFVQNRVDGNE